MPWHVSEKGIYGISIQSGERPVAEWDDLPFGPEDAALVVAAVNSLPELLDRVEKQEAALQSIVDFFIENIARAALKEKA